MGSLCAIGEPLRVQGFAMAGAVVLPATEPEQVRRAWQSRPAGVEVVVLTPAAAGVLGTAVDEPGGPLSVVLPS
ncbi:hypothetical protein GCM10010174_07320 [Kutzneria viridogrisea]